MSFQKELGQNLLIDKNILEKINKLINNVDKIVEIGAGTGNLTDILIKKNLKYVIEQDRFFVKELKEKYPQLKIIHTDALLYEIDTDLIVGNLPYNISKKFILKCVFSNNYKKMFFMLQKEFADRLINNIGKNYGALSVFLSLSHKIIKHFDVKPTSFFPKPKVFSSFVSFEKTSNLKDKKILSFLEFLFKNRRKKLSNILKQKIPENFIHKRPDEINIDEYKILLNILKII